MEAGRLIAEKRRRVIWLWVTKQGTCIYVCVYGYGQKHKAWITHPNPHTIHTSIHGVWIKRWVCDPSPWITGLVFLEVVKEKRQNIKKTRRRRTKQRNRRRRRRRKRNRHSKRGQTKNNMKELSKHSNKKKTKHKQNRRRRRRRRTASRKRRTASRRQQ